MQTNFGLDWASLEHFTGLAWWILLGWPGGFYLVGLEHFTWFSWSILLCKLKHFTGLVKTLY